MPTTPIAITPPTLITVIPAADLFAAWRWLIAHLPARPQHNGTFVYNDLAGWLDRAGHRLLNAGNDASAHASSLYLASQLVTLPRLLHFLNKLEPAPAVVIPSLDENVRVVIASKPRFRAALGEHLAFWIQAALSPARRSGTKSLALIHPNPQPEDHGPDGLSIELGKVPRIEVISVKNSINDPKHLIRSDAFESKKQPKPKKQLDELYRMKTENLGINRLQQGLARLTDYLQVSYEDKLQMGLLLSAGVNAVVVADHQHAQEAYFTAYRHIRSAPSDLVATYVGADCWQTFASATQLETQRRLQVAGVW